MDLKTLNDTPNWEWPKKAGTIILEVLRDKKASEADRITAAGLAGNGMVMDDNMANHLLDIVRDSREPEELRCKAAVALGPALEWAETMEFEDSDSDMLSEKGFNEVREQLREIYRDTAIPKKVRRRILEAAVRSPMEWQKKAIEDAYATKDEYWLLTAIFAMGYVPGFQDRLLDTLKNEKPDTDLYYEAVCSVGEWGLKEAWPYIEKIFTEYADDKPLLLAAIEAAGNMAIPHAADFLGDLSDSDDEEIAEAAQDALQMAGALSDNLPDEFFDDDLSEGDLF